VAPHSTQPQESLATFHIYNTSSATQTVIAVQNQQGGVVVPALGTQLKTGQSTDISVELPADIAVYFRSAASSPNGTLTWPSDGGAVSIGSMDPGGYLSGGCAPTSGSCSFHQASPGVGGGSFYLADDPGAIYAISAEDAQQQSDILQYLVADDLSNATFYPKSQPTIGYTNPMQPQGFAPVSNFTTGNVTYTFTVAQTTSQIASSQYNVSVTEAAKLERLTSKADLGAQDTWGTSITNTATNTSTTTTTVPPGDTVFIYTETPVYRFYGDWSVVYGNTTYILNDVWFDSPYSANGSYPFYVSTYTCQTGSADCALLAGGTVPAPYYNPSSGLPTYPLAGLPSANGAVSADQAVQRQRWGRLPAVNAK
jgi:hypothetical protein